MKSQKAAGHSQNKENEGLLCYKHKWLSFPSLEIDKSFLILIKAKYFCCMINPLLTKLVPSRWLDISLVYVFFSFLWTSTSSRKKRTWPASSHLDFTLGQQRIFTGFLRACHVVLLLDKKGSNAHFDPTLYVNVHVSPLYR